jgi:hypothetical protein
VLTSAPVAMQVACPPTWVVAGFAGCYNEPLHGGRMGGWDAGKSPPLAHFVGAPDKPQNMKYVGFWNHDADSLAEWTNAAMAVMKRDWGGQEDGAAAQDPFEADVASRLLQEGARIRAELGSLAAVSQRCAPVATNGPQTS